MTDQPTTNDSTTSTVKPLRIWVPVLLLIAMPAIKYIPPQIDDAPAWLQMSSAIGPAVIGILILVWWTTFSRALWQERVVGLFGTVAALAVAFALSDQSMQDIPPLALITVPLGLAGFGLGAVLLANGSPRVRTLSAVALAAIGFGFAALNRNEGMRANAAFDLDWRWKPTAEEQLLLAKQADSNDDPAAFQATDEQIARWIANPIWPGFRGPKRDGQYTGPRIEPNWTGDRPEQLWSIPVGPGWSSFAVAGKLLFTQEQRGPLEAIVCYWADTGAEIWVQQIESRFEESLGGPGPRATPTVAANSLFVQGASGQLMRLSPTDGAILWQSDLREIADREPPYWGFSSSPLVVDSLVVVHAGGQDGKGTLAFDIETGDLVWSAPAGDHSYSSPQLADINGQQVVLMLTNSELTVLDPATGEVHLTHRWEHDGYRALQPRLVDGNGIILPSGLGTGTRLIRVSKAGSAWVADEVWTSLSFKPDFNDLVIHDGHIFGFDATIFACIDLETGDRVWKKGRYGAGQVLLLEQSRLLLVVSEKGEVVLLKADPTQHQEIAKFAALDGKTWNHPVVIGDRLYVRNAQQAACYRLPLAGASEDQRPTAGEEQPESGDTGESAAGGQDANQGEDR